MQTEDDQLIAGQSARVRDCAFVVHIRALVSWLASLWSHLGMSEGVKLDPKITRGLDPFVDTWMESVQGHANFHFFQYFCNKTLSQSIYRVVDSIARC